MKTISKALLSRLPRYLEHLKSVSSENGTYISSTAVAAALGLGHALVRKDLSRICDKGHPKKGYVRLELIADIESHLGYNFSMDAVLVGTGKLGSALLDYPGFLEYGMNLVAGFDIAPEHRGESTNKPVYPLSQLGAFCREQDIRLGIITVTVSSAQQICDLMVENGILSIWNFAPTHLRVPEHVRVHNENLAVSLAELRMQLRNLDSESCTCEVI